MPSTGRYHLIWNLHDISSVGEEAEGQPQGITSHSITSWPVLNDVKLYPIHIRLDQVDIIWFSVEIFGCKQCKVPDSRVPEARGPAGFDSGITAPTTVPASLSTHLMDQAVSTLSSPVSSLHQIQCFQLLSNVAWGWVDIQWLGGHYLVPTCLNCYLPLAWPYTDTLAVVGSI